MKHIKKESDGTAGSRNHGTVREGAAYLVFGVLTTLIDYVISNGLFYLAHMDPVPAQEPRAVWGEFTSFVLCRIATFLFNLAAIFIMVDILKMEFFICKLAISVVVVVLNYVLSKLVIFTHKN